MVTKGTPQPIIDHQASVVPTMFKNARVKSRMKAGGSPIHVLTRDERIEMGAQRRATLEDLLAGLQTRQQPTSGAARRLATALGDIKEARTHGVIRDDPATDITEIASQLGVIGAVVPSTNQGVLPANNIINLLKCGNAIVISPSPKEVPTCEALLTYLHAAFDRIGLSRDLVQMIPDRRSENKTHCLLEIADTIVISGSQNNVRRAHASGTLTLAVRAGNVTVIVGETADPATAGRKFAGSKPFGNATCCSSEKALVVVDAI